MQIKNVMAFAFLLAAESKCVSMKVGAVIIKGNNIISSGINGTPSNMQNCCDYMSDNNFAIRTGVETYLKRDYHSDHSIWSDKYEIHAEVNAIKEANAKDLNGSTICITHSPCVRCATLIASTGIKKVIYCIPYWRNNGNNEWYDILISAGIEVYNYPLYNVISLLNIKINEKTEYYEDHIST